MAISLSSRAHILERQYLDYMHSLEEFRRISPKGDAEYEAHLKQCSSIGLTFADDLLIRHQVRMRAKAAREAWSEEVCATCGKNELRPGDVVCENCAHAGR